MPTITRRIVIILAAGLCLGVSIIFGATYLHRLDTEIRSRFEGQRWALPAKVYARPLELYPGLPLTPDLLETELVLAGYRRDEKPDAAGSFYRHDRQVRLISRSFHFPSGVEPSRDLTILFNDTAIATISEGKSRTPVSFTRLDPAQIGSFHPLVHEDRIVVKRDEIPEALVQTLLLIEDRSFYDHVGLAPTAIFRALVANIKAGRVVQGGSTLTQQLVKNLFLNQERSMARKAKEALMALVLERHYSKDEILTAYVNEIFLGQDRNRAIHGFALAAHHYFGRQLDDLRPDQLAMLVGLVKGPSAYDPFRHPERSRQRRDTVLATMADHGLIDPAAYATSRAYQVVDSGQRREGFNRFPAFLDLVRQQLSAHYREEDLTSAGLQILTTLDPSLQLQMEDSLRRTIDALEATKEQNLQGAALVTARETGDVLAVAGDRIAGRDGFNRALQARRPIGSLIKPAVYLAALEQGYTLASVLDDTAVTLSPGTKEEWRPHNYDRQEHGPVPLYLALANSYNLATVRLGLAVGLDQVAATITRLGSSDQPQPFPSLLLGAVDMSPLQVCTIYQTIAAGGFRTPLRAISSVMAADHRLLDHYGLTVEQQFPPETIFLLTHALQRVVTDGTAASLLRSPKVRSLSVAGKTGTSDDLRDSWFAGFTGSHLGVVWLGRDDNQPTSVTGSGGAMQVWQQIFERLPTSPLEPAEPPGITWASIDRQTASPLPFIAGTEPAPPRFPAIGETIDRTIREVIDSFNQLLR